jgi:hypothetical protein
MSLIQESLKLASHEGIYIHRAEELFQFRDTVINIRSGNAQTGYRNGTVENKRTRT